MSPYDPDTRYFGPQDNWLTNYIAPYPIGIPEVKEVFNKGGYNHDSGYEGQRRKGFLGWLKDIFERMAIDDKLIDELTNGINQAFENGEIKEWQRDIAQNYADLSYTAIRAAGWKFFRTGEGIEK